MKIQNSQLAGRGNRFLAQLTDSIFHTVLFYFGFFIVLGSTNFSNSPEMESVNAGTVFFGILIALIIPFVIQIILLSKDGQTIGKKLLKIKIVEIKNGKNGGFLTNVMVRGFVNGLLCLIPFYGLLDVLFIFQENKRCIHDALAGTTVIKV